MGEHFDVVVVGAGLSGIGAGYHLQTSSPERSYVILEGRERLGGTWDLFRYPGIRSDSDMHTLGFSFRPWTGDKAIADGPSILRYLEDTAREFGIDRLRILGGDETTGRGTALAAGQYLTDDIYLEIITDARGFTATQLEVALTKALSVLSQTGSFGGSNVNVRYSKNY